MPSIYAEMDPGPSSETPPDKSTSSHKRKRTPAKYVMLLPVLSTLAPHHTS